MAGKHKTHANSTPQVQAYLAAALGGARLAAISDALARPSLRPTLRANTQRTTAARVADALRARLGAAAAGARPHSVVPSAVVLPGSGPRQPDYDALCGARRRQTGGVQLELRFATWPPSLHAVRTTHNTHCTRHTPPRLKTPAHLSNKHEKTHSRRPRGDRQPLRRRGRPQGRRRLQPGADGGQRRRRAGGPRGCYLRPRDQVSDSSTVC